MKMKRFEMYDAAVVESKRKTRYSLLSRALGLVFISWAVLDSAPQGNFSTGQTKYWIFFRKTDVSESGSVSGQVIGRLKAFGVRPIVVSNWLQAVSARLSEEKRHAVLLLPFVEKVQRVIQYPLEKTVPQPLEKPFLAKMETEHRLKYGTSLTQNNLIHVTEVHDLGFTGKGVRVGMLDTGFNYRNRSVFAHLDVLGEYDFIFNDQVTSNQADDPSSEDRHGTETLSVIGGFEEGLLIGPAYEASYALAKTEWLPAETRIEEDFWVAGLEWLVDSMRVQIVSSSLGYNTFDDGTGYTYADMDGNTCVTTVAADMAVQKGVTVVVSAGNERNSNWHYILSPADGDSVIAVGAVTSGGNLADFSSVGPTSDGRIKPDVVTMGVGVTMVDPNQPGKSTTLFANGTSFSCPQVAGVCALLKQARPELSPVQIREAVRSTASRSQNPDMSFGWGVVNALDALFYHGPVFTRFRTVSAPLEQGDILEMDVLTKEGVRPDSVSVYFKSGSNAYDRHEMVYTGSGSPGAYQALIPSELKKNAVRFFVMVSDSSGNRFVSPIGAPAKLYAFEGKSDSNVVVLGNGVPDGFILDQNYPNPFNAFTTITFQLGERTDICMKIVNLNGHSIRTLLKGIENPGKLKVVWDGRDSSGRSVASGIYVCVVQYGKSVMARKMTCVR
jgi:hypothetical protein